MTFPCCEHCDEECAEEHDCPCNDCPEYWCQALVFRHGRTWQCEDMRDHGGTHYAHAIGTWADLKSLPDMI